MKQINTYINEKLRLSAKPQYTCQPESKNELQQIIIKRIKKEGPNCDLNDIDTSKITDMSQLFDAYGRNVLIFKDFNGDISQWNVSNVHNMEAMFFGCEKFNCDLSSWDVSKVKKINAMFRLCAAFDQDLSKWDVSNVENMWYAFRDCPTTPKWYDRKQYDT